MPVLGFGPGVVGGLVFRLVFFVARLGSGSVLVAWSLPGFAVVCSGTSAFSLGSFSVPPGSEMRVG